MREKRYSKDMKGTQEEEKESYPYFDIYPLEREVIKKYNYAFKARIRVTEDGEDTFAISLLNGACDWYEYSEGGCSLIRDYEIAERLCTPSELKKKKYGELPPYRGMSWLNLQARALRAASYVVKSHLKIKKHENGIYSRDLEPHQKR